MLCTCLIRHCARFFAAALAFLSCSAAVLASGGTYDPATMVLTTQNVTLGAALYDNMQLSIAGVRSGSTGGSANGGAYSYDTASHEITAPSVTVGDTTYYNVVATVGTLVSAGQVSGADVYDGAILAVPYVQVGATGNVYANVEITVEKVVRVDGGMPNNPRDVYDPVTGQLSIGAVQVGNNIYTNVVITVGNILSVGAANPSPVLFPGTLTTVCTYSNCFGASAQLLNTETSPLHITSIVANSPLEFAQTNDCPAALDPGQSCSIYVHRLSNVATEPGTLTVTDDGPGSPRAATVLALVH